MYKCEVNCKYVNQYVDLWDFFGVIRVMQKGEVVFERCGGYACLEFGFPNPCRTNRCLQTNGKEPNLLRTKSNVAGEKTVHPRTQKRSFIKFYGSIFFYVDKV